MTKQWVTGEFPTDDERVVDVYDGLDRMGSIIKDGRDFYCFDAADAYIGHANSHTEASAAVRDAWRRRMRERLVSALELVEKALAQ